MPGTKPGTSPDAIAPLRSGLPLSSTVQAFSALTRTYYVLC
jgi:hypothetical protein